MHILGMAMEPLEDLPILILKSGSEQFLPLPMGPSEASAVLLKLEGIIPPRPHTHDLLTSIFTTHGFILDRLEIYDEFEGKYLARLNYHKGDEQFQQEIRPSDGMALSVRMECPIWVNSDLVMTEQSEDFILHEKGKYLFKAEEHYDPPVM